ncbi:MAG: glutamine--tRNA ligase/YqeY domain fusion protein [Myxococcales bacterium]|nr:glutamine--tRNA ligase/YqeY domain fusion protein [Myxococcales bacterium]
MTADDRPIDASKRETDDGPGNFLRDVVAADIAAGKNDGKLVTRFPPEPNGYLHVGHAKAICINFELAQEFGGVCNLRFDDTNPTREYEQYIEAIQQDIRWLGFDWGDNLYFASDYFDQLYAWAVDLIKRGLAYVESLTPEQVREYRGDFHKPGRESPYRDRSVEENLALLEKMRAGEMAEGEATVRAKIDMQSGNMNMRDPIMYRVLKVAHHRAGDKWCIYPTYDYAHGQSDAIEGITHSLCSLEFEGHRPLYDWFIEHLDTPSTPRQIEFARLNIGYTVLSKRRLLQLVKEGHVAGWDDPRMPTLRGMRRRGIPPEAIRKFADRVGVARRPGVVDISLFEHAIREQLNATTPRVFGVLDPLKLVITNFPEGHVEELEAPLSPEDPSMGSRTLRLTRELFIERDDFREEAPKKWFRFAPGREVRLRYGCLVTCNEVIKDEAGEVVELRCTWDPDSKGGSSPDGRKVRGTSHWVSAADAVDCEVRLYDRLFSVENPTGDDDVDYLTHLNPSSLEVKRGCKVEPYAAALPVGSRVQFERVGYFAVDNDTADGNLVWNRTISLRDSWAKVEKKQGPPKKG